MIGDIERYITSLYPNVTFGQLQNTPDSIVNMNIFDNGHNPFFADGTTHTLNLNLTVRDASYEIARDTNESIGNFLNNIYDKNINPNIHIVNTKNTGSQEPIRDEKNRYNIYSTFEMLVEII